MKLAYTFISSSQYLSPSFRLVDPGKCSTTNPFSNCDEGVCTPNTPYIFKYNQKALSGLRPPVQTGIIIEFKNIKLVNHQTSSEGHGGRMDVGYAIVEVAARHVYSDFYSQCNPDPVSFIIPYDQVLDNYENKLCKDKGELDNRALKIIKSERIWTHAVVFGAQENNHLVVNRTQQARFVYNHNCLTLRKRFVSAAEAFTRLDSGVDTPPPTYILTSNIDPCTHYDYVAYVVDVASNDGYYVELVRGTYGYVVQGLAGRPNIWDTVTVQLIGGIDPFVMVTDFMDNNVMMRCFRCRSDKEKIQHQSADSSDSGNSNDKEDNPVDIVPFTLYDFSILNSDPVPVPDKDEVFETINTKLRNIKLKPTALGQFDGCRNPDLAYPFNPLDNGDGLSSFLRCNIKPVNDNLAKVSAAYTDKLRDAISDILGRVVMLDYINNLDGAIDGDKLGVFKKQIKLWCTIHCSTRTSYPDIHARFSKERMTSYEKKKPEQVPYLAYLPLTTEDGEFSIQYYEANHDSFYTTMPHAQRFECNVKGFHLKMLPAETVHTVKASKNVDYLVIFIMINPKDTEEIDSFDLNFQDDEDCVLKDDLPSGTSK